MPERVSFSTQIKIYFYMSDEHNCMHKHTYLYVVCISLFSGNRKFTDRQTASLFFLKHDFWDPKFLKHVKFQWKNANYDFLKNYRTYPILLMIGE